jgi:uncharacterized membrane protein
MSVANYHPSLQAAVAKAGITQAPPLRSARTRFVQTLIYEAGGLLMVTPLYAWVFKQSALESLILMLVLSALLLLWTPFHNLFFDWVEGLRTGRVASDRPHHLRLAHAVSLEATSTIVTLPAVMWLGGYDFMTAIAIDVGLTLAYTAYGYIYHLGFDWIWPVRRG